MRIDMKRAAVTNQRKGLTWRTVGASIWFVLCLIFAYFFTGWLFSSQTLTDEMIYGEFGLPGDFNLTIVRLFGVFLLVAVLQFVAVIFFAVTNPAAKVRSGQPTANAQAPDYYEQQYNRRA